MTFDDAAWLGEANRHLGRAVRAGVGVLLENEGWDWYYLNTASQFEEALSRVLPRRGVIGWGGDKAVLSISEWLDPIRAISFGEVFQTIALVRDFQIRISRDIWDWSVDADAIRADLRSALDYERVFFSWPKDRRPRRTRAPAAGEKINIASTRGALAERHGATLAGAIGDATHSSTGNRTDIIVASSAAELREARSTADLLIIVDDDAATITARLDEFRTVNAAQCVLRVPRANASVWLREFGSIWAGAGVPLDLAISATNRIHGGGAEVVASNQTFLEASGRFLTRSRRGERTELTFELDFLSAQQPPQLRGARQRRGPKTPPPSKRILEATVFDGKRRIRALPPSGDLRIDVVIKLQTPAAKGQPEFPDNRIQWTEPTRLLQVHLVELDGEPQTKNMSLPRHGSSEVVSFNYHLSPKKSLDVRLMVCDGLQILQTCRLIAKRGDNIAFSLETDFASLEDRSRAFDLGIMVNDSLGGRPGATVLSPDGVTIRAFDTGQIGTLREQAKKVLEDVVVSPTMPLANALMQLADAGKRLLNAIRAEIGNWPDDPKSIQVSTKDNAFFPLEFLYDGEVPDDPDAQLCPNYKRCLLDPGASCSRHKKSEVLCPMGFLGLRAVIERQVWSHATENTIWLKQSAELSSRKRISQIAKIAFAATDAADEFKEDGRLGGMPFARIQSIVDELETPRIGTWKEWSRVVKEEGPEMGLLIAHIDNRGLYIGARDGLTRSNLQFGTASIAILLGCSSAVDPVASLSLPATILQGGSTRVVVAALTDILGRHANTAGLFLGREIREASKGRTPVSLGSFVLDLRRKMLANDMAAGLVLVALGDADIALGA
jgi:hypothetical protein